jgi:hypothetical protein
MAARRIASVAALLGGAAWLAEIGLVRADGGANTEGGPAATLFLVGLACIVIATGAAGYTLAEKAPVWLRVVVMVATPLLVMMVWQMLDRAVAAVPIEQTRLLGQADVILAAVIALLLGGWGLRRRGPGAVPDAPVHRGRRRTAARRATSGGAEE